MKNDKKGKKATFLYDCLRQITAPIEALFSFFIFEKMNGIARI